MRKALEVQLARIDEAWPVLSPFYDDRIINTLNADGSFAEWPNVFARMFS